MTVSRILRPGALLASFMLFASLAPGATITIVNKDGANEGFNDQTVVSAVGGNPGTKRGAQRLNVFTEAAAVWGSILPSTVTIKCDAYFNPLQCDANGAVLGSTAPWNAFRDFSGAEFPGTWYVVARSRPRV